MDISELSDEQKSVMLARVCGWETSGPTSPTVVSWPPDLYDPANMALAWRVARWSWGNFPDYAKDRLRLWWKWNIKPRADYDPQRSWLDKILELAIEAGLVDD